MVKAIRIGEHGGPEVMKWVETKVPLPQEGEVLIEHGAVGLNFIDVYHRTGLYPVPELPWIIGMEGAGTVIDIGPGVTEVGVGDRVAYAGMPPGSYAEARVIPAHRLVPLPDDITMEMAAAMMLQGMTVSYLFHSCYKVKKGDAILFHAAAGGVGLIACQWAKALGVTIIGTVGSDEKADIARSYGCDHPIVYTRENFTERVREITNGEGVSVVYDSIGKDTFDGSLDSLRPLGTMVSYGNASGPVPDFNLGILGQKGSLFLTRPSLMTYTAKREDLLAHAGRLFDMVTSGKVTIKINQRYPLSEAAQAHMDLEARNTTGSTILLP